MLKKTIIRKKFFLKRKKNYFEVKENFFNPLIKTLKNRYKSKPINLSLYFPTSFELNVLKILENPFINKYKISLPVIINKECIQFYEWKNKDVLCLNNYGICEPLKTKILTPNVILLPLLAYDSNRYRLGYGKGFYDRYLNKYLKKNKKIITVGIAFLFQKYHNLPFSKNDVKLDYILNEKGLIK